MKKLPTQSQEIYLYENIEIGKVNFLEVQIGKQTSTKNESGKKSCD